MLHPHGDIIIFKAAHHVHDGVAPSDVREELSEACVKSNFGRPLIGDIFSQPRLLDGEPNSLADFHTALDLPFGRP